MEPLRKDRCGEQTALIRNPAGVLLATEPLRAAHAPAAPPYPPQRAEDRAAMFWRICGGTLLSIAALACTVAYQQLSGSISELRVALNRLNETNADLVRKDELNNRVTTIWSGIKELSSSVGAVNGLRERSLLLEQQVKAGEEERKEMAREIKRLSERLAAVEGRQALALPPKPTAAPAPERTPGGVD